MIIDKDVLSCRVSPSSTSKFAANPSSPSPDLISSLILSDSDILREGASRILNTIASFSSGREYLLQHPNLIRLLFSLLKTESIDNIIRQGALGILQKFSLRRTAQTVMVKLGIMEWICEQLLAGKGATAASEYSIQYGSALLMNLALRSVGRRRSETFAILPILSRMLEFPNEQVRTYINGTLYSIMSLPSIRADARSLGMAETISSLMKRSQGQSESQLSYIFEQLGSDANPDDSDDEAADTADDIDSGDEDFDIEEDVDELVGTSLAELPRFDELLRIFHKDVCASQKLLPSFSSNPLGMAAAQHGKSGSYALRRPAAGIDDQSDWASGKSTARLERASDPISAANDPPSDISGLSFDRTRRSRPEPLAPGGTMFPRIAAAGDESARANSTATVAEPFLGRPKIARTPTTAPSFVIDGEFDYVPDFESGLHSQNQSSRRHGQAIRAEQFSETRRSVGSVPDTRQLPPHPRRNTNAGKSGRL